MKKSMLAAVIVSVLGVAMAAYADSTIYNSIPNPYPYNLPSQAYQACQTAEFGDEVGFAGTARDLTTVTVAMSDWAARSDYMVQGPYGNWITKPGFEHVTMNANGFFHPLTLNLYNVDNSGSVPTVGSVIATKTVDAFISWRPESTSGDGRWDAPDGHNYGGLLCNVEFDFSADNVTLPDQIIYGLAFNTNTWGANPIGKHGPYESLNFGCSPAATAGIDMNPDAVFMNTVTAQWYADHGAAGVGTFRQDTNWAGYVPAVEFQAVPEPATMSILGLGLVGLIRRRNSK